MNAATRDRLTGCKKVGQHIAHGLGETGECFNRRGREPG
jgi:hypothetical protein